MEDNTSNKFVVIVLAGDRGNADPVAANAGTLCKAIAPVAGRPMVLRVLDALEGCEHVGDIILCGPQEAALDACPELSKRVANHDIRWLVNQDSPSKSVEAGLSHVEADMPVLVTTADHALLTSEMVTHFIQQSIIKNVDATFGLVEYQCIKKDFPGVRRTVIKLRDGQYCGCNLFAFMTETGRKLVPFWRGVEQKRKRPWKMVAGIMGIGSILFYLFGMLSLERVLSRLSSRLELKLNAVLMPYSKVGIDVDTPQDRKFVEEILRNL